MDRRAGSDAVITLRLILLILALVCLFLSAFGVSTPPLSRVNLMGLGLFLWLFAEVLK